MPSQGPLYPAAVDLVGGGTDFDNPSNVLASDNAYSGYTDTSDPGRYIRVHDFGFALPAGSNVIGIEVFVEGKASHNDGTNWVDSHGSVILMKSLTAHTNKVSDVRWSTTDVVRVFGSDSDLWLASWNPAEINDSGLGVIYLPRLTSDGTPVTVSIDSISMTVHYTPGGSHSASILIPMIGTP